MKRRGALLGSNSSRNSRQGFIQRKGCRLRQVPPIESKDGAVRYRVGMLSPRMTYVTAAARCPVTCDFFTLRKY
ncbi:MAG: hypothetical protein IKS36_07305 [Bacteroidales bacterium]|nr:hypothetical protein [Bacteroidales bacterium]